MQLSSTYYSLDVTISFCRFWFENDTLVQVRYCHLLGIWCFFIVDMLFSSFFDSVHDKRDVYLRISFIYTSDLIIKLLEMFHVYSSYISNMKNINGNI